MKKEVLSDIEAKRYARHISLKHFGLEGQLKLLNSKVLIIGAGGLGSPVALYLAAAGVGTIGIADGDEVDISNLQRQIIHSTDEIGVSKVVSAKKSINTLNPDINVITYDTFLDETNMIKIIQEYDFIIDGTDNFKSKFLINKCCVKANKPFSHGGIQKFNGQTMTIIPHQSACYACVFNSPPPEGSVPSASVTGVLGSIAGMLGTIQATEAIKYLIDYGELLTNKLLIFDATTMDFDKVNFQKNPDCKICGKKA